MKHAPDTAWVVVKFGGTSVATTSCWDTIAEVIAARRDEGLKPVVVCSALAGVSNLLIELQDAALNGKHEGILSEIENLHRDFATQAGISTDTIASQLDELRRLVTGAGLVGEVSPRLHAQIMAFGELMATRLGQAYLASRGLNVAWQDARQCLRALPDHDSNQQRSYLYASCAHAPDDELTHRFRQLPGEAILTQGFIAVNDADETVLLGRGGSDVSAAYFAAKLGAARCEIWTDVPGMFTANPHKVPTARLIKTLDYDEAQEIASSGAKVLHPRCITPIRTHGIPLHIHDMKDPRGNGTVIGPDAIRTSAQVKAISSKIGVTLISMDSVDMWHQVGFLADVFACFKKHGLSVDLVSTSETNVSVTLDKATNALDSRTTDALLADLSAFCTARVIGGCAFVSLVGKNIRAIVHQLGTALEVFEEQNIYLISQAANDLNFTFVVDEDQADRLVTQLHGEIFGRRTSDALLGSMWKELYAPRAGDVQQRTPPWWRARADELISLAKERSPLYVYDAATIDASIARLKSIEAADRVFYSVKANPHPDILKLVYDAGLNFECVSPGEIAHVMKLFPQIDPQRVLFTPNFASRAEYEDALKRGVYVTLDNLYPLQHWPESFADQEIFVRMDPGRGRGHHKYVHTAGTKSKFGVPSTQIDEVARRADACGARVVGLHAHVGSNIFQPETWSEAARYLATVAERFPKLRYIDVGGGLGVVEKNGQAALDTHAVDECLREFKLTYPKHELWIEPGRFIVAEAGVLLATVTQTKHKGDYAYVGIDAGMNTLIRPALYGSHHEIVNLSRLDEQADTIANVVGPICESGDILGYARALPASRDGDIMLIATTGAYGKVMSCSYNLREPAKEHFLKQ